MVAYLFSVLIAIDLVASKEVSPLHLSGTFLQKGIHLRDAAPRVWSWKSGSLETAGGQRAAQQSIRKHISAGERHRVGDYQSPDLIADGDRHSYRFHAVEPLHLHRRAEIRAED